MPAAPMISTADLQQQMDIVRRRLAISSCSVHIDVRADMRTADYTYRYVLSKVERGGRTEVWPFVLSYGPSAVRVTGAGAAGSAVRCDKRTIDDGRTCIWLEVVEPIRKGESRQIWYSFTAPIETLVSSTGLHRSGVVNYWIAHVLSCAVLTVSVRFASPPRKLGVRPVAHRYSRDGGPEFSWANLEPFDFKLIQMTYSSGVPRVAAKSIELTIAFMVGVLSSLLASSLSCSAAHN